MEILSSITLVIFIVSVIGWLFTWSKACSFLKEPTALSFFFWPNIFLAEKFKAEGEGYRKKSLIFLFAQLLALTILMVVNGN